MSVGVYSGCCARSVPPQTARVARTHRVAFMKVTYQACVLAKLRTASASDSNDSSTVSSFVTSSTLKLRGRRLYSFSWPPRLQSVMYLLTSTPTPQLSTEVTSARFTSSFRRPVSVRRLTVSRNSSSPSPATRRPLRSRIFRSPIPRSTISISPSVGSLEILDEHDFVLLLVVHELVDPGTDQQESEPARAKALQLADRHVLDGIARMRDRGVIEVFELETWARIGDSVHQHFVGTHAGNPDFPFRIQAPAPFDGIHHQFPKGRAHRVQNEIGRAHV